MFKNIPLLFLLTILLTNCLTNPCQATQHFQLCEKIRDAGWRPYSSFLNIPIKEIKYCTTN